MFSILRNFFLSSCSFLFDLLFVIYYFFFFLGMENDLSAILAYFEKRHKQNLYFYYDVKASPKSQMINFLWVNNKFRLWYDYYNDVTIFDSTNDLFKYHKQVTLSPLLGINLHGQFIILGWALLLDQSKESFVWLFDSWLRAMHGKQPTTVITNPNLVLINAIKTVFPNTCYRLSLSHMKRKFKDQIAKLNNRQILKEEFKRCVTNSTIMERFERD